MPSTLRSRVTATLIRCCAVAAVAGKEANWVQTIPGKAWRPDDIRRMK